MIPVLGDEYIAQYVLMKYREEQETKLYKNYLADALYVLTKKDQSLKKRYNEIYADVFIPNSTEDDEQVAAEIKESMLKKLNGRRKRTDGFDESGGKIEP